MTKQDLQKEILEKVKPDTKPSDLKKLKRSKSADDIPSAPPLPNSLPLNRSKSSEPFQDVKYPYTTLISQQEELEVLKKETVAKSDTIALLRKKIGELEKTNPPSALLNDQLKEKQKEVESLRAKLDQKSTELSTLQKTQSTLLDDHLTLKHQGLKDWWKQYEKTQQLEKELKENVDYASEELLNQDQTISTLRSELRTFKQQNQSLQKDLDLAQKLAELRRTPLPSTPLNSPWIPYALSFLLIGVTLYLTANVR